MGTEYETKPFDPKIWRAETGNTTSYDNLRSDLVVSLLTDHLRVGMGRTEVEEMLGPPSLVRENRTFYTTGISTYGIKQEYLLVDFEDEKVVFADIGRG